MKPDRIKLYFFEILLLAILILALFVLKNFNRTNLAIILTIFAILIKNIIKKTKKVSSMYKKQVFWLMLGFSIIYVISLYLLGIYFGYYKSPTTFGINTIVKFILPFVFIIISSESIRNILLVQKGKLSKTLTFVIMVLIDMIIYSGVYDITKLDDMLTLLGFIGFASIACNLLYNYITIRFSWEGVVLYRLITILYIYLIPYIPDIYIFFNSFLRMLYPYIIYLVLEYTYSKTNYATEYKDKSKNIISISVGMIVTAFIIGLISCQFTYGILVIGSGSMTGSIDVGDAIVYRKYDNDEININTVIIFNKDNSQIIHRVVDIISVKGETRYYTKGDANIEMDSGYVTVDNIEGIVLFKIKYIGYPTLWLRDIFSIN